MPKNFFFYAFPWISQCHLHFIFNSSIPSMSQPKEDKRHSVGVAGELELHVWCIFATGNGIGSSQWAIVLIHHHRCKHLSGHKTPRCAPFRSTCSVCSGIYHEKPNEKPTENEWKSARKTSKQQTWTCMTWQLRSSSSYNNNKARKPLFVL